MPLGEELAHDRKTHITETHPFQIKFNKFKNKFAQFLVNSANINKNNMLVR